MDSTIFLWTRIVIVVAALIRAMSTDLKGEVMDLIDKSLVLDILQMPHFCLN